MRVIIEGTRDGRGDSEDAHGRRIAGKGTLTGRYQAKAPACLFHHWTKRRMGVGRIKIEREGHREESHEVLRSFQVFFDVPENDSSLDSASRYQRQRRGHGEQHG